MPTEELETNFDAILKDIESCRGRATGDFITRCFVLSPPSTERFVVDTCTYVGKKQEDSSSSSDDDESDDDRDSEEQDDNSMLIEALNNKYLKSIKPIDQRKKSL